MDLRIQIQNLDRQLRTTKQEAQFLRINCQTLGTTLCKTRELIKKSKEHLLADNSETIPILDPLDEALNLNTNEIASTIIQQGIALAQLRALYTAAQEKLEKYEPNVGNTKEG
jgi:hypothetical protein